MLPASHTGEFYILDWLFTTYTRSVPEDLVALCKTSTSAKTLRQLMRMPGADAGCGCRYLNICGSGADVSGICSIDTVQKTLLFNVPTSHRYIPFSGMANCVMTSRLWHVNLKEMARWKNPKESLCPPWLKAATLL